VNAVFRRFYLVRWRAAILLSLPGVLLAAWYGFGAFARFDMYRRFEKIDAPLTLELFHIALFDVLRRDMRHVWLSPPPDPSALKQLVFRIDRPSWEALKSSRDQEERSYVKADLVRPDRKIPVEVRLLGQRHWNVLYKQMSLKVQLPRGELLDGYRVLTLSNDPAPMVVGEQIMLDTLADHGVLVPAADFARVHINGTDLGVFRYETQPDESLLREHDRQAGSMYSGDLPGSARSEELWAGPARWRKVAWREEQEKLDMSELERLLSVLRTASVAEFADFARHEIDLEAFAWFEAVDIAFGCDQHNYRENHKLYFDPYKGRWEPVAWGLRGFEHDPVLNRVENPIMLRLKLVPGYLARRNRALYELLTTDGSGSAVRARGMRIWERIGPDLATDPYWDAYRVLPRVDELHRQMVRPMNMRRAMLVFESELETYERRRAFLIEQLRRNSVWLEQKPAVQAAPVAGATKRAPAEPPAFATDIDVIVDGEAGFKLEALRAQWPSECTDPSWYVARAANDASAPITATTRDGEARLGTPLELYAGTRLEARSEVDPEHGAVQSVAAPTAYRFTVHARCTPAALEAVGLSLATGARVHSRPASKAVLAEAAPERLRASDVPAFAPGERSAHPWSVEAALRRTEGPAAFFPLVAPARVDIGPGRIEIDKTRVYEAEQEVHIAAGTELRLAPGASLVFLGRVHFEGTAEQPIALEPAGSAPWGGIVLQGLGTRGSRFSHVVVEGGSAPSYRSTRYPGMINLHDTEDIRVDNCAFADNRGSDDVLHASYVKELVIEDSRVRGAHADALDIELSQAHLRRITVLDAGDDALDLMGSTVEVRGSVLIGLRGNGVSAGEETRVSVQDTLIADATVGLLAKNASHVTVDGSLVFRATTGVRIYKRTVRYDGDSSVSADVLFVVDSARAVQREDGSPQGLDLGRAQLGMPRHDALDHLRDNVLELSGWPSLPTWIEQRRAALARGVALQGPSSP
jgi:hypothetical protein